jgi:hypothetical protein
MVHLRLIAVTVEQGTEEDVWAAEMKQQEGEENYAVVSSIIYTVPYEGDKSMGMRWERHIARVEDTRNVYQILLTNPEGRRLHGNPSMVDDNYK